MHSPTRSIICQREILPLVVEESDRLPFSWVEAGGALFLRIRHDLGHVLDAFALPLRFMSFTPWALRPVSRISLDADADALAVGGHEHELVLVMHGLGGNDLAGLVRDVHGDDALAAAVGACGIPRTVVRLPRPFSETTSSMVSGSLVRQADDEVVRRPGVMPRTPAVARPMRPQVWRGGIVPGLVEAQAHAFMGDEADLLVAVGEHALR